MKTIFAITALISLQFASAQKTVKLEDFKSITVGSEIKIDMVKGNENKLVFNGGEAFDVQYNNGGVAFEGEGSATLYFKNELESITIGSDAEVSGKDEIKGKHFNLTAGSDSEVALNLNVQELHVTAGSDSKVSLSGKAGSMRATVGSDGAYHTEELKVGDVTVNLGSDAEGTVYSNGIVNANVGSDGSLKVYGKPKKVNEIKGSDASIKVM